MPTTLITGAAGQDGILLGRELLARGHDVAGLVMSGGEQSATVARSAPGVRVVESDVTDRESMARLVSQVRPDAIAHLAGATSVAASWTDPAATLDVNVLGTIAILEAVRRWRTDTPASIVVASSGEVFGTVDGPCRESTPILPLSPYAVSKATALQLVAVYRQGFDLPAASAILFNHESPLRPPTFVTRKITQGVAAIVRGAATQLTLGTLDVRRDWGWAPDYVRGMADMLASGTPRDLVLATGQAHSLADFLTAAFTHVGIDDWQPFVTHDEGLVRPIDSPAMVGDASAAAAALAWRPTVEFADMVRRMVDHDLQAIDQGDPGLVWWAS